MDSNTVSFQKKWIDRTIPLRFALNNWLLQKLGLFGFGFVAFAWGVVVTILVYEFVF